MYDQKPLYCFFKRATWKTLLVMFLLSLLTYTKSAAAPGDLDTTFNGDGKVTTDIGGLEDHARAIAIQPDGKIVAVGYHFTTSGPIQQSDFVIVRYKSNGVLDTTFSGDGKLTTNFGALDQAADVAIQLDGKIVVAGQTCDPNNGICDLALARYRTDGSLDTSFGGDGKISVDFGIGDNGCLGGIAIQPDNKILVAGYMHNGSDYDHAIYRFNASGSLDNTFGSNGRVNTGFGTGRDDEARDIAIQFGKIIFVGRTCGSNLSDCNFTLARYLTNGTLETAFGRNGKVITNFGGRDMGYAIAILPGGKILAAGYTDKSSSGSDIALARYQINGSLDPTFSGDGKLITNFSAGTNDYAFGLAIQPDGKIMVSGWTGNSGSRDFGLIRLKSNGSPDITFSGDGKLSTDFGGDDQGYALALQENGRIIAAGWTFNGVNKNFALARYLP